MLFNHLHYVPCIPWKQGEYQAIYYLSNATKQNITPLIELPEFGYDHETKTYKKTVEENITDFGNRVYSKWKTSPFFIDFSYLNPSDRLPNSMHPVQYIFDNLRSKGCNGVPVTGLGRDMNYQQVINQIVAQDHKGVCLRISLMQAAKPALMTEINDLMTSMKSSIEQTDLILDLGTPNFQTLQDFNGFLLTILQRLPHLKDWRTFTILGTAIPKTITERGRHVVPRYEWQLYQLLVRELRKKQMRIPSFGDYTTVYPSAVPFFDWRKVSPSARVIYTIDNAWLIFKGKNAREHKEEYQKFCKDIIDSGYYTSANFSWADKYISECRNGTVGASNLGQWVKIGVNHHIEKVTRDIASFYAS
jgi:hypothetical protein